LNFNYAVFILRRARPLAGITLRPLRGLLRQTFTSHYCGSISRLSFYPPPENVVTVVPYLKRHKEYPKQKLNSVPVDPFDT